MEVISFAQAVETATPICKTDEDAKTAIIAFGSGATLPARFLTWAVGADRVWNMLQNMVENRYNYVRNKARFPHTLNSAVVLMYNIKSDDSIQTVNTVVDEYSAGRNDKILAFVNTVRPLIVQIAPALLKKWPKAAK